MDHFVKTDNLFFEAMIPILPSRGLTDELSSVI